MVARRAAVSDAPLALRREELDGETTIFYVKGELELFTASDFRLEVEGFAESAVRRLVIDLSGVRFIDSAGIAALLAVAKRLRTACSVALVAPEACCRRALELVQIPRLIPTYDTLEEALEELNA